MTTAAAEPTDLAPVPQAAQLGQLAEPIAYADDAPEFSAEVTAKLRRPVDPAHVELRQAIHYVPWVHYQDVLLDAFGPGGYRMVPLGPPRVQGNTMTWRMALTVRPPGQRKFYFIKDSVGECAMHAGMSPGNAAEGAQSDALTKGCKALGIFRELFDPAYRRWWETEYKAEHLKAKARPQRPGGHEAPPGGEPGPKGEPAAPNGATATDAGSAGSPGVPTDPGEAATDEAYKALAAEFRRLKFTRGGVEHWCRVLFGVGTHTALSAQQVDLAYPLLTALQPGQKPEDSPLYQRILAEAREKGQVR